MHIYCYW